MNDWTQLWRNSRNATHHPDKAENSLAWVQYMTTLHHSAEEIIFAEIIYE
jgi:hypothetical protein